MPDARMNNGESQNRQSSPIQPLHAPPEPAKPKRPFKFNSAALEGSRTVPNWNWSAEENARAPQNNPMASQGGPEARLPPAQARLTVPQNNSFAPQGNPLTWGVSNIRDVSNQLQKRGADTEASEPRAKRQKAGLPSGVIEDTNPLTSSNSDGPEDRTATDTMVGAIGRGGNPSHFVLEGDEGRRILNMQYTRHQMIAGRGTRIRTKMISDLTPDWRGHLERATTKRTRRRGCVYRTKPSQPPQPSAQAPRQTDVSVCLNCGKPGHPAAVCVGPPNFSHGDIPLCPLHGSLDGPHRANDKSADPEKHHQFDQCPQLLAMLSKYSLHKNKALHMQDLRRFANEDVMELANRLVFSRLNRITVRSRLVCWLDVLFEYARRFHAGQKPPQLQDTLPWSKDLAKSFLGTHQVKPWESYDYVKNDIHALPVGIWSGFAWADFHQQYLRGKLDRQLMNKGHRSAAAATATAPNMGVVFPSLGTAPAATTSQTSIPSVRPTMAPSLGAGRNMSPPPRLTTGHVAQSRSLNAFTPLSTYAQLIDVPTGDYDDDDVPDLPAKEQ